MDCILLVNKEKGLTSRDVVNTLSKRFKQKKIGHFGTLDPLASGLLVVGLGAYTKVEPLLSAQTKEYVVSVLAGVSTDTYDITGNVLNTSDVPLENDFVNALNNFIGTYNQEVPIYSAVKVNGKKLYEYARSCEEVVLPKKEVTIFSIDYLGMKSVDGKTYFNFKCLVSKGTYIRSLINDISKSLNCSLCMSDLVRTKCGDFEIGNSYTLDEIEHGDYKSYSISDILDVEEMEVSNSLEKLVLSGSMIDKISDGYILFTKDGEKLFLYGPYLDKMKPYLTFKK